VLGFFRNLKEKLTKSDNYSAKTAGLIEMLIKYRQEFKKAKNWEWADRIRKDLTELNIKLKDTPNGTEWEIEE
ncbi:MAG: cysteine--tRNA ligase, partial [Candidatus Stygibacter australis]|nr:cysteine--tRNA ligase [Candidatus Stygibacter australis]